MTELEKMSAGLPFDSFDPAICELRGWPLAGCGKAIIMPGFHCEFGGNTYIGGYVYIHYNVTIQDAARVTIGDRSMIGAGVRICATWHPEKAEERHLCIAKPVTIGKHVAIGANSVICYGVTIGDNSIIGAGSVVTKNIPANVVAYGNPCKVVRSL